MKRQREVLVTQRIIGFDIAQALAVFGIVVVNFKTVMVTASNKPTWLKSVLSLLDGRAAATFVVLAGAGISLQSQKARASGDADQLVQVRAVLHKRAAFLLLARHAGRDRYLAASGTWLLPKCQDFPAIAINQRIYIPRSP